MSYNAGPKPPTHPAQAVLVSTENRRVAALLECAARHGLSVEQSVHAERCWTIRGDNEHSLTVYGGENHSASVMGDLPGERDWIEVSQRHATFLMASGTLWLVGTRASREVRPDEPACGGRLPGAKQRPHTT